MSTVILIGAPGSGKTTAGSLLARRLGQSFIDTDKVIEEEAGMPISEIFLEHGEDYFRKLEKQCIERVLDQVAVDPAVVSLGGGSVLNPQTQEVLKGFRGIPGNNIIWLHVDISEAIKRIGMNQARPLLLGNVRSNMIKLLNDRTPIYQELASASVETSGQAPETVVDSIVELVNKGAGSDE